MILGKLSGLGKYSRLPGSTGEAQLRPVITTKVRPVSKVVFFSHA